MQWIIRESQSSIFWFERKKLWLMIFCLLKLTWSRSHMKEDTARCHARPRYSSRRYTLTLKKLLWICATTATAPRTRVTTRGVLLHMLPWKLKINRFINLYSSLIYLSYFHCCIFFCWSWSKMKYVFLLRQLSKRNTFKTAVFFSNYDNK